jgi:type II secretory pathway pseudopilin PulG
MIEIGTRLTVVLIVLIIVAGATISTWSGNKYRGKGE